MYVRNLDGHEYSVDWHNDVDGEATHYVGHIGEVEGVKFMHARLLPKDGTLQTQHSIMRIEVAGDEIKIRQLNDTFFDENPVKTDAELRDVIAKNLKNGAMFDGPERVAKRVPPPPQ